MMMWHGIVEALAGVAVLLAAPLFGDLALCALGNLRGSGRAASKRIRRVRLAAVIPAHNEELMIARAVRSLRAADAETTVFVVAHNCTDETAMRAEAAGARVVVVDHPEERGKGAALRHGFAAAQAAGADAFLVMDADSEAGATVIAATRQALEAGAEATQCRYELALPEAGLVSRIARVRAMAFRGINVWRPRGRAALGFSAGVFGNGFALTTGALERAPFTANSIVEDLEYHIRLVKAGLRVQWIDEAQVLAPLSAPGSAQASQEARWEGGRLWVAGQATLPLLGAALRGRWRALETLAEAWCLPLSRGILLLALMAVLPLHPLRMFAVACVAVTVIYVVQTVALGEEPMRDLAALAAAPTHLLWKAVTTPLALMKVRKRAEWTRTKREVQQP